MAEIVVGFIFIIPMVLGLAEILHTVKMFLLSSSVPCERILIVFPDDENFPRQITKTAEERSWRGNNFAKKILISTKNISEENTEEVERITQKYGFEIYNEEF